MKETNYLLQTYEIFLKLIYLKLLQEYLNNEIIGFTDKADEEESVYYTVTDIQGSITEVYDGSCKLVWKSGYTAFGELAGETVDLIDFDGMYTGCDYDADTGLTYHWNRWRSEDGSRFISEDPVRDGANWYGYAGQNPMVYVDRTGLFASNGFLGTYAAEQYNTTPEVGPQPNPNATPQNQTPNITGPTGMPNEVIPTQQDNSIWIYDSSDKFQDFPSFNYNEYLRQQFYAELYAIAASVRDLLGKIGNSIVNIFTGKASYNVYANASINILNINCSIFDLKIGSKGQDLSFSLDQKATDQFLETFEKLIDAPITLTTSKLKVNIGDTSFTLQNDKTNLKVNVNFGKNETIDLGALGEGLQIFVQESILQRI